MLHRTASTVRRATNKRRAEACICLTYCLVDHFASTLGAGESFENLNWLWRFIFRVPLRRAMADHLEQERHVRDSGLQWTIVRPAAFTDGEKTEQYRHGFTAQAEGLTLKISRADVADFMIRQLRSLDYLRKTPALSY